MSETLKEYYNNTRHTHGTYINVKPLQENKDQISDWVKKNGINNPLDPSEYHTTVIYSKAPCPDAENYDFKLPITGKISGWEIFDAGIGRCLVAKVNSDRLQEIHSDLKENYGATSDFPSYIPHITISYNYTGDAPSSYPDIEVTFSEVEVKPLDPTWKPKNDS